MIPETTSESSDVRCPYCLELQSDSWEFGDGGEGCDTMECGHCEKEFTWERSFIITYKGTPLANAEPLAPMIAELQPEIATDSTAISGCERRLVRPLDSLRVDHRGDEKNAPVIHVSGKGTPVKLIVGKDDETVRYAAMVLCELMGD